jgi:hypothetical protein
VEWVDEWKSKKWKKTRFSGWRVEWDFVKVLIIGK